MMDRVAQVGGKADREMVSDRTAQVSQRSGKKIGLCAPNKALV